MSRRFARIVSLVTLVSALAGVGCVHARPIGTYAIPGAHMTATYPLGTVEAVALGPDSDGSLLMEFRAVGPISAIDREEGFHILVATTYGLDPWKEDELASLTAIYRRNSAMWASMEEFKYAPEGDGVVIALPARP